MIAGLGAQSGSAAEDPRRPGLPDFGPNDGWVGPEVTGIAQVKRAKQGVRFPPIFIGAYNRPGGGADDNQCVRFPPFKRKTNYHVTAFFRSDPGAAEPWGYSSPFSTRTVAFGSIPVEATVQLRQPRDEENLPVGIEIRQELGDYCDGVGYSPYPNLPGVPLNSRYAPASVEGSVEVVVLRLKVDGVDLDLTGSCRTREPGPLSMTSREHFTANPENLQPGVTPTPANILTTPYLNIALGGLLFGTADIPPFAGCTTASGEDVSPLLTATISGPGNPVTMRTNGLVRGCVDLPTDQECEPLLPGLPFPADD